jgi:hypothetical protein
MGRKQAGKWLIQCNEFVLWGRYSTETQICGSYDILINRWELHAGLSRRQACDLIKIVRRDCEERDYGILTGAIQQDRQTFGHSEERMSAQSRAADGKYIQVEHQVIQGLHLSSFFLSR